MQRLLSIIGPLPFMALAMLAAGCALGVAIYVFQWLSACVADVTSWPRYPLLGIIVAASYFAYGLSLLLIAPAINFLLGGLLKPCRGPAVSLAAMRWYVHCTMTLVVRYSFLEFVTPSAFSTLYYRLMGMKIGKNVAINSTAIADPSLITMEDNVTIGGSASVLAHYAQGGYLVEVAKDGVEALEKMQEQRPDVMITDVEMPRMDGFDLTRNVRTDDKLKGLPIIMITSRTAEKHRQHATELGVDVFLGKPYEEGDLLNHIKTLAMRPLPV